MHIKIPGKYIFLQKTYFNLTESLTQNINVDKEKNVVETKIQLFS